MSNTISGEYEDFGDFGLIDGVHLVPQGKGLNAKTGDDVEAVIMDNTNSCYEVVSLVDDYKNKAANIIEGIFNQVNEKYGFVDFSKKEKGIYIDSRNMSGALSGDKVEVIVHNKGGKSEGMVSKIISYRETPFVGKYVEINGKYCIESSIGGIKKLIELKKGCKSDIKKNNIITFNLNRENPDNIFGEIVSDLGNEKDKGVDILQIAVGEGARLEFPEEVLSETESLNEEIELNEIEIREDLRELFTITIDGPDSKDLDDAISIEKLNNGKFKLFVHIADVTHYIEEDSFLDKEAIDRGTSIYLVDKVIPMLPEKLSNNLCSLNPKTDKLSMTCEMIIDENGNIDFENSKVYESVINSDFRMTYKEVHNITIGKELNKGDELMFLGNINEELIEISENSRILAKILNTKLKNDGELNFDFDETKVIVDEKGNPTGFKAYEKHDSNDWIKAFMVSANTTVSKLYESFPFLHRTHSKPDDTKLEKLLEIFKIYELDISDIDLSSQSLSKLLEQIKGHEAEKFLSKTILLTLKKANYTHEREGHFGLSLGYYSHFTSPIRRYPDLQIHRIIKEINSENFDEERREHYEEILGNIAMQSSIQEDVSENIEKKINSLMAVKYMSDKIGKKFTGYISSIDNDKVFIELDNTIKGILNIDKSIYCFNKLCDGLYELVDSKGDKINVGNELSFTVSSVDEGNLNVYFNLGE